MSMQFKGIPVIHAEREIPRGMYCYKPVEAPSVKNGMRYRVKRCPFWGKDENRHDQESGYCSYLKKGDWMTEAEGGTFLLWDQVKECGVKPLDQEELE